MEVTSQTTVRYVFDHQGNVSFDKYLMNFLAVPWEKDGKYYDRYTDPEYVTWLKMFRELGEEGLLANDIFVDTRTQMIAFMDYMMSEHGQMLIYLGVEGVTYDIVDGKPVLKEDVSKILNSDRETYDRLYGADDAYWMLQNNVMQLQWKQKAGPATEQLLEWACKYTVYNGQYDVSLSTSPEIAAMDEKCTKLWSETLPKLLLAPDEVQFDEIFEEFVEKRNAMVYQEVLKQKTVLMNAAKEKMEISE